MDAERRRWRAVYALVIITLAVLVGLFSLVSWRYQ
jgi:hypothetical protein